jgi:hypothetical protein
MLTATTLEALVIAPGKLTVPADRSFVVFLIGMRVNRWWMVPLWLPVTFAMGRMLSELMRRPDSPLLSFENYFGRTTYCVQYWTSLDELMAYAHDKESAHVPAWQAWARRIGLSGSVGIWHETYVIEPGQYECVYVNMPAFGLGKALERVPAEGELATAQKRMAAGQRARAGG